MLREDNSYNLQSTKIIIHINNITNTSLEDELYISTFCSKNIKCSTFILLIANKILAPQSVRCAILPH